MGIGNTQTGYKEISGLSIAGIPLREDTGFGKYPVIYAQRTGGHVIMCYNRPKNSLYLNKAYFNENQKREIQNRAIQGLLKKVKIEELNEEVGMSGATNVNYLTDQEQDFLDELARKEHMFYSGASVDA